MNNLPYQNMESIANIPPGITHITEFYTLKSMCPLTLKNVLRLMNNDPWFIEHFNRFLPVAVITFQTERTQEFIRVMLEYPDDENSERSLFRLMDFGGWFFIDSTEYPGGSFAGDSLLIEQSLTLIHEIDEF